MYKTWCVLSYPLNMYLMWNDQIFQLPIVQFHTGLGDADIALSRSSPAHLQPLLAAFPDTPVVLLHSAYPFTREAGYLTAVFKNVYLDFGEVFPFVSASGQKNIVKQVLELCPTNKILWSSTLFSLCCRFISVADLYSPADGHWWPETYYLATKQVREILLEVRSYDIEITTTVLCSDQRLILLQVLTECVESKELTLDQAVGVVRGALFDNANKVYKLNLVPDLELGLKAA